MSIMLNDIDLRLIERLEVDGRASYLELARTLNINPATAAKRVKKLLAEKIIAVKAVPNPEKLGQPANALIVMNVDINRMDEICSHLKQHFNVNMIATTFGRFNLLLRVHFPSWDKLIEFVTSQLSDSGIINEIDILFIKDRQYLSFEAPDNVQKEKDNPRVDETDFRLIEELADDGRHSCIYLADKLGISLSSTSKRLANLLKEDVIHIRATGDPSRMGYHYNAFVFLKIEPGSIEVLCNRFEGHPETRSLMRLGNGYDICFSVLAKSADSLYDFIKRELASQPGIIKIETLVRGELIKRYYGNYQPPKKGSG